jgi:hypothetical protein
MGSLHSQRKSFMQKVAAVVLLRARHQRRRTRAANHWRNERPRHDAQGLPVPGASGERYGLAGVKSAVTDTDGRFAVPFLTPGQYDVRVELQGFKPVVQKSGAVGLGQTVNLPISMAVGNLTETVQVTASAPTIDMTTTTSGATVPSESASADPRGPHACQHDLPCAGRQQLGNSGGRESVHCGRQRTR